MSDVEKVSLPLQCGVPKFRLERKMQQLRLDAEIREAIGKGGARSTRRAGKVPCILYGLNLDSIPLQVDERQLRILSRTEGLESMLINLDVGTEKTEIVMIKDVQRDPISRRWLHADFLRISLEKEVTTHVLVTLLGTPTGVREDGGVQGFSHRELAIRCLPTAIPEHLELDVSGLAIGDNIRVSDIDIEVFEILDDPETVIVTISPPKVAVVEEEAVEEEAVLEEAAEEEAAEPEVITRRREVEEEA